MSIDSNRFIKTPTRRGDSVPSRGNFTQKGIPPKVNPVDEGIVRRMEPQQNKRPSGVVALSGAPFTDAAPGSYVPSKSGKNKKFPQADLSSAAKRKLMGK